MVPVETVWTVVVVVMRGDALELEVASQIPSPTATATITTAETMAGLRVNHFLGFEPTYASLAPRPPGGVHRPVAPLALARP
jgi:hypothetical protein